MKPVHLIVLSVLIIFLSGCQNETVSRHVTELSVDFTWNGLKPCGWGNPEIHIGGVPENASTLVISMYDHAYSHDHGTVKMPYAGEKTIPKDRFKEIQRPCPVYTPGRYEITVKVLDDSEIVIAMGSKERFFPEGE